MEEANIEDIKVEQRAVICYFISQGKTVKQTLNELRKAYIADEILPEKTCIGGIKHSRMVEKVLHHSQRVVDQLVKLLK